VFDLAVVWDWCSYDYKCKSHECFLQNTLTPISSEICTFISDINFVNTMFVKLKDKLANFDLSKRDTELKLCKSYIGSIKHKLKLKTIE
jgi:hypothetical protein